MVNDSRASFAGLSILLVLLFYPTATFGATYSWDGSAGAQFTNPANWSTGVVPGAADTAIFRLGNVPAYPVWLFEGLFVPVNRTVDRMIVGTNTASFAGGVLTIDNTSNSETGRGLIIGETAGDVAVVNSALQGLSTVYATLGSIAGSSGTLNVNSGTFTVSGSGAGTELIIGRSGTGVLNVGSGAAANMTCAVCNVAMGVSAGSSGSANVSGTGTWNIGASLTVGSAGAGELNVSGGGTVNNSVGFVAQASGSAGEVNVSGAGSTWTNTSALAVGFNGIGTMSVSGGGVVQNTAGIVGNNGGSEGIVHISGDGSTWTNTSTLDVGNAANSNGALNVFAQGVVVVNAEATVGREANSDGSVTVDGMNSRWTINGNLNVGRSGDAMLEITNHGRVVMSGGLGTNSYIGRNSGSTGDVTVSSNGLWLNSRDLYIGDGGMGTLTISQGQVTNVAGTLGNATGSEGTATVSGIGALWNNTSGLLVGNSGTATLLIEGGGVVNSGGGIIGAGPAVGMVRTAAVTGSDGEGNVSRWTNSGDLIVANFDSGTLTIDSGGRVESVNGIVGNFEGSKGEVTVIGKDEDGIRSAWDNTGNVTIGNQTATDASVLRIEAGAIVSNVNGIVGNLEGSKGEVTVTGAGSEWTNSGDIRVGVEGTGTLNIHSGGKVTSIDGDIGVSAQGTVSVSDAGSMWTLDAALLLGSSTLGNGTLNIEAGGIVSDESGSVAFDAMGEGTVTVTGTGSAWTHSTFLRVGDSGTGTMTVNGGGSVSNDGDGYVAAGNNSIGTATVSGDGSTWTSGGNLFVGNGNMSMGTLTIEAGGAVSNENGSIGVNAGSDGTLNVTDATWTNSIDLFVGNNGAGTLNVTGGGEVNCVNGFISFNTGAQGMATVDGAGSRWTNSGDLSVGHMDEGVLTISNGGTVEATNLTVGATGELYGDGNIVGNVNNSGLVSPGTSPGELSIDGNYLQAGELLIELASAASYDQLLVTGTADLAGTLEVSLLEGFAISGEHFLTILSADDVNGSFTTELLPSLPEVTFDVVYNPTNVVLHIVAPDLPGDYNGDGTVDAADYVVWRRNDGTQEGYDTWRANFGQTGGASATGSASANAAIPEPASLAVLLLAAAGLYALPRRQVASVFTGAVARNPAAGPPRYIRR